MCTFLYLPNSEGTATCDSLKYTLHPKETTFKCTVKLSPNCRSCCTVYISPWCHGELDIISIYTFLNTLPFNFTWSLIGKYCKPSHRFHKWRQTLEPVTGSQVHSYFQNPTLLADSCNHSTPNTQTTFQKETGFLNPYQHRTGLFIVTKWLWDTTTHYGSLN